MTTMTLPTNSNYSFIENGLYEIFGTEFTRLHLTRNKTKPLLATTKEIGIAATDGLYHRAGRAAFYYWMRQYALDLGWKGIDFRLLPAQARIRRALTDLLSWMERENLLEAELSDSPDAWQITVDGLTGSNARLECNYFIGMLQELCCWAGGGKFYPARENMCQIDGAVNCVFMIDKQPVV